MEYILNTLEKDQTVNSDEALMEIFQKLRQGEHATIDGARTLFVSRFFDPKRYDLAHVGRYKFNKKLLLKNRVSGQVLAEDVVDVTTGEIIAEAGAEKIKVIKAVREVTGLGLAEAKAVVDGAPKVLKEAASKEDAESIKAKLEEVGAKVTLK